MRKIVNHTRRQQDTLARKRQRRKAVGQYNHGLHVALLGRLRKMTHFELTRPVPGVVEEITR